MTIDEARNVKPGQILYHVNNSNSHGSPQRWKVNGQVKTWKKDPSRIRIPVKMGLYAYDAIDEHCLGRVEIDEDKAR